MDGFQAAHALAEHLPNSQLTTPNSLLSLLIPLDFSKLYGRIMLYASKSEITVMKASELKRGMIIEDSGQLYVVIEIEHRTPGNLRAIYQTTLKHLLDGRIINMRYSPEDKVEKVDLEAKKAQYLFHDHSGFHFMDMETYDTIVLGYDILSNIRDYLKENAEISLLYHDHKPVTAELPPSIDLKVIESAPGLRGDTSGKVTKPAKLETGLVINVPLFIEEGEMIRVDTRTGQYLSRA